MATEKFLIVDGDNTLKFAKIDDSTFAIKTIDYAHSEIHDENAYFMVYSALRNTNETAEVRIQTPDTAKYSHMTIVIDGALAGTAQLWEGTTKTDASGNRITPMNRNRNSSNVLGLTICHTPTGTESATANITQYFGATATGGRAAAGGAANTRAEFIMKRNTAYLIRGTSRADGNAISIIVDWYEHTDKL